MHYPVRPTTRLAANLRIYPPLQGYFLYPAILQPYFPGKNTRQPLRLEKLGSAGWQNAEVYIFFVSYVLSSKRRSRSLSCWWCFLLLFSNRSTRAFEGRQAWGIECRGGLVSKLLLLLFPLFCFHEDASSTFC